jgi:protein-disulfide isomerase
MRIMKVRLSFVWIAIVVVIVSGFLVWENVKPSDGTYDDFAKCLASKGVVMYGSRTCSHCNSQKKLFGDSFKYVTYVECSEQVELCQQNGISGVPTWVIDGEKYPGEQSIERLSQLTGCEV